MTLVEDPSWWPELKTLLIWLWLMKIRSWYQLMMSIRKFQAIWQCMWRHLVAKFLTNATYACGAICLLYLLAIRCFQLWCQPMGPLCLWQCFERWNGSTVNMWWFWMVSVLMITLHKVMKKMMMMMTKTKQASVVQLMRVDQEIIKLAVGLARDKMPLM